MKRVIFIRLTILAALALASVFVFYSTSRAKTPASKENIEECCNKKCKMPDNDLMLETFSRQLISICN